MLNQLIADIQMLALSLSTQCDAEERRQTLYKIRELSWHLTSEITLSQPNPTIAARPAPRSRFGVNDL